MELRAAPSGLIAHISNETGPTSSTTAPGSSGWDPSLAVNPSSLSRVRRHRRFHEHRVIWRIKRSNVLRSFAGLFAREAGHHNAIGTNGG
jgi:hypothetical protein